MESSSCFTSASGGNRLIGELNRGRETTVQLLSTLTGARNIDNTSVLAQIEKILNSFTESLSILKSESDEVCQVPELNSPSEYSGESCKMPTPTPKSQRGSYKRRRNSETRSKDTPTLIEDGHAWRKYGQKMILNTEYPRNYFRCTHKFDQKCKATKHVQKIQDDPPLFRTTYYGHHTCNNAAPHQIIMDAAAQDSSTIWNFQCSNVGTIKQEETKDINCQIIDNNNNESSSITWHDYYRSPEELGATFDNNSAYSADHDHATGFSGLSDYFGNYTSEIDPMECFDDLLNFGDQELLS